MPQQLCISSRPQRVHRYRTEFVLLAICAFCAHTKAIHHNYVLERLCACAWCRCHRRSSGPCIRMRKADVDNSQHMTMEDWSKSEITLVHSTRKSLRLRTVLATFDFHSWSISPSSAFAYGICVTACGCQHRFSRAWSKTRMRPVWTWHWKLS